MFESLFGTSKVPEVIPWIIKGRFVDASHASHQKKSVGVHCSGILAPIPSLQRPALFFNTDSDGFFELRHNGDAFDIADDKHYWIRSSQPWIVIPDSNNSKSFRGIEFSETDRLVDGSIEHEAGEIPLIELDLETRLRECADKISDLISKSYVKLNQQHVVVLRRKVRISSPDPRIKTLYEVANKQGGVALVSDVPPLPRKVFFQLDANSAADIIRYRYDCNV